MYDGEQAADHGDHDGAVNVSSLAPLLGSVGRELFSAEDRAREPRATLAGDPHPPVFHACFQGAAAVVFLKERIEIIEERPHRPHDSGCWTVRSTSHAQKQWIWT